MAQRAFERTSRSGFGGYQLYAVSVFNSALCADRAADRPARTLTRALEQVTDQVEDCPHLLRADDAVQQQQLRELGQARRVVRRVPVLRTENGKV